MTDDIEAMLLAPPVPRHVLEEGVRRTWVELLPTAAGDEDLLREVLLDVYRYEFTAAEIDALIAGCAR